MARRLNLPSRLQWQLLLRCVDPWLLAAFVACVAGAVLQWVVLPAVHRQAHALDSQARDVASRNSAPARATLTEERFQAFRDRLVDDSERTEILRTVFAEAANAGIALQQGDYALFADTEGDFAKLQISLPVKGTYSQIRAYAQTLLDTIPGLSLDEITIRRDSVRAPNVEARLRLTLFLKGREKP